MHLRWNSAIGCLIFEQIFLVIGIQSIWKFQLSRIKTDVIHFTKSDQSWEQKDWLAEEWLKKFFTFYVWFAGLLNIIKENDVLSFREGFVGIKKIGFMQLKVFSLLLLLVVATQLFDNFVARKIMCIQSLYEFLTTAISKQNSVGYLVLLAHTRNNILFLLN